MFAPDSDCPLEMLTEWLPPAVGMNNALNSADIPQRSWLIKDDGGDVYRYPQNLQAPVGKAENRVGKHVQEEHKLD